MQETRQQNAEPGQLGVREGHCGAGTTESAMSTQPYGPVTCQSSSTLKKPPTTWAGGPCSPSCLDLPLTVSSLHWPAELPQVSPRTCCSPVPWDQKSPRAPRNVEKERASGSNPTSAASLSVSFLIYERQNFCKAQLPVCVVGTIAYNRKLFRTR